MENIITIRNRPIKHYILSIISLLIQNKKVVLKSRGSLIGKTIDITNLINEKILPNYFKKNIEQGIEDVKIGVENHKTSYIKITLTK